MARDFVLQAIEIKNIIFSDTRIGYYKVGGYCFEKLLGTEVIIDKILYYSHIDYRNSLIRVELFDKHGNEVKTILFHGQYYIEI